MDEKLNYKDESEYTNVVEEYVEIKNNLEDFIKDPIKRESVKVTGITDDNGNIELPLNSPETTLILCSNNEYNFIPFVLEKKWYVTVCLLNGKPALNTEVTFMAFYTVNS